MSRLRNFMPVLLVLIAALPAQAAHPSNPFEWMWRTNGLHWGEGYHAYNGCYKQGVLPRSHVPGPNYYPGNIHAGTFDGGYGYYSAASQQAPMPYPAQPFPAQSQHEYLPPPMVRP